MLNLIFMILIGVFAVLLTVTVALALRGNHKLKHYNKTTGTIMKFRVDTTLIASEAGRRRISPIVSYTVNGRTYELVGSYCSTSMKVGQKVDLLYNQEEPSQAMIKKGLYVGPMITGALTLMLALAIVIFLILRSKGILCF